MAARAEIQPAGEVWLVGEERPCGCFVEFVDLVCDAHRRPWLYCPDCEFVLLGVLHKCEGGDA